MKIKSILSVLAVCFSLVSQAAYAGSCDPNRLPSTPDSDFIAPLVDDGTVTHKTTNLTWKRCAEGQIWSGGACTGSETWYTWSGALTAGRDSSFAGYTDWRVPNIKELRSLVEECRHNPAINDTIFPGTPDNEMWSSSPRKNNFNNSFAWSVNVRAGLVAEAPRTFSVAVRLVRDSDISYGPTAPPPGGGTTLSLSPSSLDFGVQGLGTSSAEKVSTLRNSGTTDINILGIGYPVGDYSLTTDCASPLAAGQSCTIGVSFGPSVAGSQPDSIVINSSASGSPHTLRLTGTGGVGGNPSISITKSGTGTGTVSGQGIDCGSTCSASYTSGTSVTLTATAAAGSTFAGWIGDGCSGTTACTLNVTQAHSVMAAFTADSTTTYVLRVSKTGAGTVSGQGIDCGSTCSASYASGTSVTLSASADTGSTFMGWSGGVCSGVGTCKVDMTWARSVTADFVADSDGNFALTVSKAGTGTGTVSGQGINCGSTCVASYASGTSVTLSASAAAGSTFTGWSGSGCSGPGACTVNMSQASSVTATFTVNGTSNFTLTVAKVGTGTGTVSAQGLNCGSTCSASYASGTSVTLSAGADTGSTFTGWSDSGCSGTGTCTLSMSQARSVTATFTAASASTYVLTVSKAGTGTGTVSAQGLGCGTICSASYASGANITLTAAAASGSTFAGWSGGVCSGTTTCTVSMTQARSVTATFTAASASNFTLTVSKAGTGTGTVSGQGIDCGSTCSAAYASGTSVTLSASADTGSTFTGWSGGVCSGTTTCTVSMTQARSVTATFTAASASNFTLTVAKVGTGTGTVSGQGIDCGSTCSASYASGANITLTATAASGSTFAGWSGAGCSGTGTCTVNMSQARSVIATFNASGASNFTLTVSKAGTGAGTVTAPSLNCGTTCNALYASGANITLTAVAASGSTFTGWSGGVCSGSGGCALSMTQARSVTATFTANGGNNFTLTVSKTGTGTGTVSAQDLSCGATCSAAYASGTSVTLSASADTGSTFTGWSGSSCSGTGACTVNMSQARGVSATFTANSTSTFVLTTSKTGAGGGTITAPGLDCGTTCSAAYGSGANITLTATAASGSTFTGWSGAGCSGTGTCTVSMTQARSVIAAFSVNHILSVTKSGVGSGTVTSLNLDCGSTCSASYASGTSVMLTVTPNAGSIFAGWSGGGCFGTGYCVLSMTQARSVNATFVLRNETSHTLSINKAGAGAGTVSAPGLDCGTTCSATYPNFSIMPITAVANAGSVFTGWSGAGCSGMGECAVSMTQARSVTATFQLTKAAPVSLYDGIYQWDAGSYLSVHQVNGDSLIASIYWVFDANKVQIGSRTIATTDTFDLLSGVIIDSSAAITGTRFYRACKLSYDLEFNRDTTITVTRTSVSNSDGVSLNEVNCALRLSSEPAIWTITRIF